MAETAARPDPSVVVIDAGADDYLSKPFGVGELHVDLATRHVTVGGAEAGVGYRLAAE